jgi:glycine/D-amino acid oxidase-like deaminating enzyme
MKERLPIAVLGAGVQGVCVALEVARRGRRVWLVEQDGCALNRTSVRNEGKIHLGLVYAHDPAGQTAGMMLEGALSFYPLLSRWLGDAVKRIQPSTPFHYLVATDSLLNLDELEAHYHAVETTFRRMLAEDRALTYLGLRPESLFRRLSSDELARHFTASRFLGGFSTEERALDTRVVAGLLREAVANEPMIRFLPAHTVRAIRRVGPGFQVEGEGVSGVWKWEAEQVVNATWGNRQVLDQTLGIVPEPGVLHRLKYRVLAQLPARLQSSPSVTMVIGRYGDVVVRPDGTVYLSWYPVAMKGWSHDLQPPAAWNGAVTGQVSPAEAGEIAREIMAAIDAWYPGIAGAKPYQVDAGVICAYGKTDVDDEASGLHNRTQIGVRSFDGYHSVSTGKYTSAPRFAVAAAEAILSGAGA